MTTLRPPKERRETANEWFDSFYNFDDDGELVLQELDESQQAKLETLELDQEDAKLFRTGAASTHNKLDRHLVEYRKACVNRLRHQKLINNEIMTELVNTKFLTTQYDAELFFPADRKKLFSLFNYYLTVMAMVLKPRSLADDRPRLATITSRRWSLLHWAKAYLENPPNFRVLQARTNAALFYAAQKYGINTTRRKKLYFGRHELRFLIDYDMAHTDSFDAAESHHLAWTIALITGVRPGAIGRSRFRPESYLRWSDIRITRNQDYPKRFDVTITFPYMKERLNDEGYLRLTILPPQNADNITLSPAYRLLAIALKRGLLASYRTYQELLEGHEVNILIDNEHLSKPIFPALTARGLGLDMSKSATASSFTQYLSHRASAAGFDGVTMYAFRRKAATNVDRAAGRPAARMFLNHNPQSMTFETSYEQANFDLDVAAIAYGEVAQKIGEQNTPTLFRAELVMTPEQITQQVEKYIQLHGDNSSPDYPLQRRRLRRQAMAALRQLAVATHNKTFTTFELNRRVEELKSPTAFMNEIRRRANAMESEKTKLHEGMTSNDAANEDDELDQDLEEDEEFDLEDTLGDVRLQSEETLEDEEEEDISGASASGNPEETPYPRSPGPSPVEPTTLKVNYTANVQTAAGFIKGRSQIFRTFTKSSQKEWVDLLHSYEDSKYKDILPFYTQVGPIVKNLARQMELEPPKMRDELADIALTLSTDAPRDLDQILSAPYETTLAAFFELMLEGQEIARGESRQCAECLSDETLDDAAKHKWFSNRSRLLRHQQSSVHAPYQKWLRKANAAMLLHHKNKASCSDCSKVFNRCEDLGNHLKALARNGASTDDPHYATLISDGFFNPNFNLSRRASSTHDQNLRKNDDVVRGRKVKTATALVASRHALIPAAPPGHTGLAVVGPFVQPAGALEYPEAFRNMPRLTPQSLRQDLTARGLDGMFVNYVDPNADASNPPGKELKDHLKAKGTGHTVEWGVPRRGDTKGKGGEGAPGQGEPTVRKF
ncbi:hypothetical protein D6D01_04897 [Aureobasidium pullulans]|uniref:Uncharacterized protein n=1 Tax=Aureobasidium pullulans TaxID=5580 RepID=A0A4S9LAI5_AURPU|nr:hypothetical protein D6D01_04897 [Aureobasidium pullulans]